MILFPGAYVTSEAERAELDALDKLPELASNLPKKLDFREITAEAFAALIPGVFQNTTTGATKALFGSKALAEVGFDRLASLGYKCELIAPYTETVDDDGEKSKVRVRWWTVRFSRIV